MTKHIILAHGILGFGPSTFLPSPVHYFNGVAAYLGQCQHKVLEPRVNPIGSIAERAGQLGDIVMGTPLEAGAKWHIIAHSMGGLDARHAIAHVAGFKERVATLVTIGTPHNGSVVADQLVAHAGPLFEAFPAIFRAPLLDTEGLRDLTTARATLFNATTPNEPGIRYIAIAGDAQRAAHELLLFDVAAALGNLKSDINDGVVTKSSALRQGYEHFEDWPADHLGEIGWTAPPCSRMCRRWYRQRFDRGYSDHPRISVAMTSSSRGSEGVRSSSSCRLRLDYASATVP